MLLTDRSIGQLVTDAVDDVKVIVAHEKALAKAELTRAAKAGGVGAGLLAAALALLGVGGLFLLLAAVEGLVDAGLDRWAAFLIVAGVLLLVGVVLALVGVRSLKKVGPPERTISSSKRVAADVKDSLTNPEPADATVGTGTATPVTTGGSTAAGGRG